VLHEALLKLQVGGDGGGAQLIVCGEFESKAILERVKEGSVEESKIIIKT